MIDLYKYMHKIYDTQAPKFTLSSEIKQTEIETRGNSLKLYQHKYNQDIRNNFYSVRVVPAWNSLPDEVIQAPSTAAFKSRLDKFWKDRPTMYNPACQQLT